MKNLDILSTIDTIDTIDVRSEQQLELHIEMQSEIQSLIHKLRELSGTAKIEHIKTVNEDILDTFEIFASYVLDPMSSYHVSTLEEYEVNLFDTDNKGTDLNDVYLVLNYLNSKGSADSADKYKLNTLYTLADAATKELMQILLDRNMRCGVSAKSLRKVFGKDFLPDFPVMLCSSYDEKKIKKNISFPAISQLKSDGARCEVIFGCNAAKFYSRNGKPYHGLTSLELILSRLNTKGDTLVVDGELIVLSESGEVLDRKTGNGILNKSIKGTITPSEADRIKFIVWDLIPYDVFMGVDESIPYTDRLNELVQLVQGINKNKIEVQDSIEVQNLNDAALHYRDAVLSGEEGTILKNSNSLWKNSRSSSQIKFKEVIDCDLVITDWYYGKKGSKYENCIGGFTIQTSDSLIKCNVGSGLSDEMRGVDQDIGIEVWANNFISKVAAIQYNARITSKSDDKETLFLPRLIEVREDKTIPDSREDLINIEQAARDIGELK